MSDVVSKEWGCPSETGEERSALRSVAGEKDVVSDVPTDGPDVSAEWSYYYETISARESPGVASVDSSVNADHSRGSTVTIRKLTEAR